MKVMNIIHDSIVDGEGFRSAIFFAGCPHHCYKCHNPQSWNDSNGVEMMEETIFKELMDNELTEVTFSGGEPFSQCSEIVPLAKRLKEENKNIWCYTGFLYEELLTNPESKELLEYVDVLVDGRFEFDKRDLNLLYKGSSNQRVIDVQKSLASGITILHIS